MSEELPKNEWLTTGQVKEQYRFDPNDHIQGDGRIYSKLVPMQCAGRGGCTGFARVWLKADVEYKQQELKRK